MSDQTNNPSSFTVTTSGGFNPRRWGREFSRSASRRPLAQTSVTLPARSPQSAVCSASAPNVHLIGHLCSLLPPFRLRGPPECGGGAASDSSAATSGPPPPRTHKGEVIPVSSGVWRPAEELES